MSPPCPPHHVSSLSTSSSLTPFYHFLSISSLLHFSSLPHQFPHHNNHTAPTTPHQPHHSGSSNGSSVDEASKNNVSLFLPHSSTPPSSSSPPKPQFSYSFHFLLVYHLPLPLFPPSFPSFTIPPSIIPSPHHHHHPIHSCLRTTGLKCRASSASQAR